MAISLRTLKKEIARCEICSEHLPLEPRPVVQFSSKSRIVIVGQAPGTKVHETGIPWDDPSGDHLREWLRVSRDAFYDPRSFARSQITAPERFRCRIRAGAHAFG